MSHSKRAQQQLQFDFSTTHEIPYGYCHCGCRQLAPIAKKTRTKLGHIKGQPIKFILGHNARPYAPPGFKFCSTCKETKPADAFYLRNDRRLNSACIDCARRAARDYWTSHRTEMLEKARKYQNANKQMLRDRDRERRSDPAYREKTSIKLRGWRERNRKYIAAYNQSLPVKARNRVNKLIESGKLPHPTTLLCADCQQVMADHYHHFNGYEREHWLDVIPLCTVCHGRAHWRDI